MLSATEPMRKFESAAAESCRPKVTKTDGYLDRRRTALGAIRNGAVHMYICNSFLPQLGYLMPATSASLIMFFLFQCVLLQLISGILKARKCKFNNVVRMP